MIDFVGSGKKAAWFKQNGAKFGTCLKISSGKLVHLGEGGRHNINSGVNHIASSLLDRHESKLNIASAAILFFKVLFFAHLSASQWIKRASVLFFKCKIGRERKFLSDITGSS